jgi:hypothetical protein
MGGACRTHGEMIKKYYILTEKPERNGPFRRPRHRREDNIGFYFREIIWECPVKWIHLAQDRVQC